MIGNFDARELAQRLQDPDLRGAWPFAGLVAGRRKKAEEDKALELDATDLLDLLLFPKIKLENPEHCGKRIPVRCTQFYGTRATWKVTGAR